MTDVPRIKLSDYLARRRLGPVGSAAVLVPIPRRPEPDLKALYTAACTLVREDAKRDDHDAAVSRQEG